MNVYELSEKVEQMLRENEIYAEEVVPYNSALDLPAVVFDIIWGDWKHDHGRAKWLCNQHGGSVLQSYVTEDNGSDCYSARHVVAFWNGFVA